MHKLFLTLIMSLLIIQIEKPKDADTLVVLELFTSQGCSSCPPADDLVDKVKTEFGDKIISLSYHVDYWNYIGWKDPFSKSKFSDKQRTYSKKFNSSSIYTPQVVINGMEHFVGSNKKTMYSKLKSYFEKVPKHDVKITNLQKDNNKVNFNYAVIGELKNRKLRVALVIKERTTSVKRGENRNRILKNTNVVVEEVYLDLSQSKGKGSIGIPDIISNNDELSLVVLVQNEALDIVGGQQITL